MAHLSKMHEEQAPQEMEELLASSAVEEVDQVPINLLQFRARNSLLLVDNAAGRTSSDENPNTVASIFSKVDELRRSSHHCRRSEALNASTDNGDDATSLPSHSFRSSVGTVSTVDDLRDLCTNEFRISAMPDRSSDLPRFKMEEVVFGKRLGQGAFGIVTEINNLRVDSSRSCKNSALSTLNESTIEASAKTTSLADDDSEHDYSISRSDSDDSLFDAEESQTRKVLADHCRRANGHARFVLKKLRPGILNDEKRMLQGVSDLARETFFLKRIRHPNIIRLRAISYQSEFDENYFLVLDRLQESLPALLEIWRNERNKSNGVFGLFRVRKSRRSARHRLKDNIVTVCFELSSALSHLHQNGILYRDLKPANVGFDFKGNLRLFDFGLAKEIPPTDLADADGLFHLTQMCGTPRFMAPEVANGHRYGPCCDVYGFALLCWQMASLKHPYGKCTIADLQTRVWRDPHERPPIREAWPHYFRQMLARGWCENPTERVSMKEIESILAEQVGMFDESFDFEQHLSPSRRSTLAVAGADFRSLFPPNVSP
jgi:serine/threonine protein kinase